MNRMLVALSAVCLPMLSVAAPPITEPVDVNVTNPVLPVEVSNADPIPVVVDSTETPFRFSTVPTQFSGSATTRAVVTVPAGKALVVDYVTVWVNASGPNGLTNVNLSTLVTQDGVLQFAAAEIVCSLQGANALNHYYACSGQTQFDVPSGATLNVSIGTVDSSGGFYRFYISGHYIDVP